MVASLMKAQMRADERIAKMIAVQNSPAMAVKDYARSSEILAKYERKIEDLTFKAEQAEVDAWHWECVLQDLNDLFDKANNEATAYREAGNDRKEEIAMRKIISLRKQIHSAESQLAKARHISKMVEMELYA